MYGILKKYILSYTFLKKLLAYERFLSNVGQEERAHLTFLAQTVEVNLCPQLHSSPGPGLPLSQLQSPAQDSP